MIRLCALFGWHISIACPQHEAYSPEAQVLEEVNVIAAKTGSVVQITGDVHAAATGADIIYTDTWMSYGIKSSEESERKKVLFPFQVTQDVMKLAPNALFMHCLPATRGNEVTEDVIDGAQSVVFDQAENRLHVQKAIILFLLNKL